MHNTQQSWDVNVYNSYGLILHKVIVYFTLPLDNFKHHQNDIALYKSQYTHAHACTHHMHAWSI